MTETVRIDGLRELEKTLREIAPQIKGNPLRNAVRAMASIVEKDAKARAPFDTGRLKRAIKKKLISRGERDTALMRGDSVEGYNIGVESGRGRNDPRGAWYWWFVEAGTDGAIAGIRQHGGGTGKKALMDRGKNLFFGKQAKGQPAKPFLRPAFEINKGKLPEVFAEKLRRSLALAAKKLAKNPRR